MPRRSSESDWLTVLLFCRLSDSALKSLAFMMSVGTLRPGGLAGIGDQRVLEARDHHEFRIVGAQRRIGDQLGDHVQGEEADRLAVRRRLAELVAAEDAAGAADILDHDGGLAGDVVGQVLRDDASLDVGGAAGRIVDDHGDGLALVELGKRNLRDDRGNQCGETGDEQKSSRHSATSQTLRLRARPPAAMTGAGSGAAASTLLETRQAVICTRRWRCRPPIAYARRDRV